MQKSFLILFIFFFSFAACNNDKVDKRVQDMAFKKLTDSIQQAPVKAEIYYRRAILLFKNEQKELAKQYLRRAWQLSPNEKFALSLAHILAQENADSVIIFLHSALEKLQNSISLQISLAKGYRQKQELQKALAICNNIISQYPNQLDALILKSEILRIQNKNEEVLATLEQAYRFAPFDRELIYELAFLYAETKNA